MTPSIFNIFSALRARIKRPVPVLTPLDFDRLPIQTRVEETSFDIQEAIQETRAEAVKLLETLAVRSELSRKRLQYIFDGLRESLIITAYDGTIGSVNLSARKLLLIGEREYVGKGVDEFFPINLTELTEDYASYLKKQPDSNYAGYVSLGKGLFTKPIECKYTRSDGVVLDLVVSVKSISDDPASEEFGYMLSIEDSDKILED